MSKKKTPVDLELFADFAEAIYPTPKLAERKPMDETDAIIIETFKTSKEYTERIASKETLFESLKDGRFKDFDISVMRDAVAYYKQSQKLPRMYCEDAQHALPTADKQNMKILCHVAGCKTCFSKVV